MTVEVPSAPPDNDGCWFCFLKFQRSKHEHLMAFLSNPGTRQHPTQRLLGWKMEGCCRKEVGARGLLTKEKKGLFGGPDMFFFGGERQGRGF